MFRILTKRSPARSALLNRCLATSLDNECKLLIKAISRACYIPPVNGGFNGTTLTCAQGEAAIAAISQPEVSSIMHVPVDQRNDCRRMLQYSLKKPGVEGRRDLLCTVAMPGSGKTVVLWFNSYWFVEETKRISIEITFNDDQSMLYYWKRVRSARQLELAISARIIHRLILKFTMKKMEMYTEKWCKEDGEVTNALIQLENPLDCTLRVVKSLLGAPSDTKVLLCVDELAKCVSDSDTDEFSTVDALRVLTQRLDSDGNFFLAVSALGAKDAVNLSTGSNRHLLLQALGPLWRTENFNPAMRHLLPEALQPFYHEDTRQWLPFRKSDMELYDELSQLLTTAAGHPRRLEVLFRELGTFKASQPAVAVLGVSGSDAEMSPSERRAAGRLFVDELAEWLHHTDDDDAYALTELVHISKKVVHIVHLPKDYSILIYSLPSEQRSGLTTVENDKHIGAAIEDLATYCAKPFIMPRTKDGSDRLKTVFFGVSHGFCQLVNMDDRYEKELLAFIPMPVLDKIPPWLLQPRSEALFALRNAIRGMYNNKRGEVDKHGNGLQEVAVASLLLMARCRGTFTLGQLCEPGSSGVGLDVEMRGGTDVTVTTVDRWPAHQGQAITAAEVQTFIDQLKATKAPGIIIKVSSHSNITAEIYGIFESVNCSFAGFRVQCEGWSADSVSHKMADGAVDSSLLPPEVVLGDGTTIPFASLLFTANRLQQQRVPLSPFQGVITIASMRTWLPTAAHALQTLAHHRELFGWHRAAEDGE